MKTDQNSRYEMIEKYFRKLRQPKRYCVIECMLPPDAVLYLFQHSEVLKIEMLVEKRGKEDYVVIEIEEDNKRVYLFQLLLDALRRRYTYDSRSLTESQERRIVDLLAKLKAL